MWPAGTSSDETQPEAHEQGANGQPALAPQRRMGHTDSLRNIFQHHVRLSCAVAAAFALPTLVSSRALVCAHEHCALRVQPRHPLVLNEFECGSFCKVKTCRGAACKMRLQKSAATSLC